MFIVTAKIAKKRLVLGLLALGAVAWGIYTLSPAGGAGQEAEQTIALSAKNIKTEEDRVGYLQQCGWQVDTASGALKEVLIPKSFDKTYSAYNEMQKQQGFDLEKYQGKKVNLATYRITNYPDGQEATASLLLYKNRVIGGDISSSEKGGFVHGLTDTPQRQKDALDKGADSE